MSSIWVICGACRGVGKTTLALKLCEALGQSVYAKCGHGPKKLDKNDNYFTELSELEVFIDESRRSYEHIVVESNAMAARGKGDVVIFIEAPLGKTNFRRDSEQLCRAADLKICWDSTVADWKKVLAEKIGAGGVCDAVCELLGAQKRYLFGSVPKIGSKVWFEADGCYVLGKGLAELLENVQRHGTLQEAAKAAGMSYRYAWKLVSVAEERFGRLLLERHAGGAGGGGSALSKAGQRMLDIYTRINDEVAEFAEKRFAQLYAMEKSDE